MIHNEDSDELLDDDLNLDADLGDLTNSRMHGDSDREDAPLDVHTEYSGDTDDSDYGEHDAYGHHGYEDDDEYGEHDEYGEDDGYGEHDGRGNTDGYRKHEDYEDYYSHPAPEETDADDAGYDRQPEHPADLTEREHPADKGKNAATDPDDFFNDDDYDEPVPPKKVRQPKLDPEDPDYWLDERSDYPHIIPKPSKVWKWWIAGVVLLLTMICGVWMWFFRPYVDDAVKYGYIKSMERRGTVVKTFEGVLIPYKELGDANPLYFEEIPFSVDGDSLAAHMKGMMLRCVPVRLEYEVYHQPLFWKGASPMIVTAADSADVSRILPPEYR